MKISVAVTEGIVSQHFGHCEFFKMYYVEDGKVLKTEEVANPGHRPGFLPKFIAEQGASLIIAGGMGGSAQNLFFENGVDVLVGASGEPDVAVDEYLKGNLKSSGSVCQH
ncbi:NifB/NifX family molybdenum-iron cluster-binding protein [Clostridium sp. DL1XJH146]